MKKIFVKFLKFSPILKERKKEKYKKETLADELIPASFV
jgi:hypothetical protein